MKSHPGPIQIANVLLESQDEMLWIYGSIEDIFSTKYQYKLQKESSHHSIMFSVQSSKKLERYVFWSTSTVVFSFLSRMNWANCPWLPIRSNWYFDTTNLGGAWSFSCGTKFPMSKLSTFRKRMISLGLYVFFLPIAYSGCVIARFQQSYAAPACTQNIQNITLL